MPFELLYAVAIVVIGGAIAFALYRTTKRSAVEKEVTEVAAHEYREHPEEYDDHEREQLKAVAKDEQARQKHNEAKPQ